MGHRGRENPHYSDSRRLGPRGREDGQVGPPVKLWNALTGTHGYEYRQLCQYDRNLVVGYDKIKKCKSGAIKHRRVRSPRESWQVSLCSPQQVELADFVLLLVRRTPPSLSSTPLYYFLSVLSHHNASLITTAPEAGTVFAMHQVTAGRACVALLPHIYALARGKPEQYEAQARKIDIATA